MWACWAGVVKGAGMPCLRYARVSQREKFMNGTTSLWWWLWWCVFKCVFMCVSGIQWRGNIISGSTISLIHSAFSSLFCGENIASVLQAFSEHPRLLRGLPVLMLSLSNRTWMCVRDTAQCQGGPWLDPSQACCRPDEKLRKRLDFSDILSLPGIWLLYTALHRS